MSGYYAHEIVTDTYDPDYGSSQTTHVYHECPACGSLVADKGIHDEWHWKIGG
jgi:hypothetical protein